MLVELTLLVCIHLLPVTLLGSWLQVTEDSFRVGVLSLVVYDLAPRAGRVGLGSYFLG